MLNFALPAIVLAFLLPMIVRWLPMGRGTGIRPGGQMLVLLAVNLAVLLAGLLLFGRDGKMLAYLAMVAGCAAAQWLMLGGWRR